MVREPASGRFQTLCARIATGQPVSNAVTVAFDTGDDVLAAGAETPATIAIHAVGGRGNDRLAGGPGPDQLEGGDGRDNLDGNEGADELDGDAGDDTALGDGGLDDLRGAEGNDRLLDGDESAATADQLDDDLRGGSGNDSLRAGAGNDHADAGTGDDTVLDDDGPGQPDTLIPDLGTDLLSYRNFPGLSATLGISAELSGPPSNPSQQAGFEGVEGTSKDDSFAVTGSGAGATTLIGLAGRDRLDGGNGPDLLIGGAGADTLRSHGGDDVIDAKAGESPSDDPDQLLDLINCGGGPEVDIDTAITGLTDPLGRDRFDGCENVERSAIGEGPHVKLGIGAPVTLRDGELRLRVSCPGKLGHACRGRLTGAASIAGLDRAPERRYRIRDGHHELLGLPVARGLHAGGRVYVQSLEKGDVKGRKTTRQLLRIRR